MGPGRGPPDGNRGRGSVPVPGKSGTGTGERPRFRTNRGRGRGSVPVPGQIGDGRPVPVPGQIGDGDGDGDRGVRALPHGPVERLFLARSVIFPAQLWVLGAHQICDPARWILNKEGSVTRAARFSGTAWLGSGSGRRLV
jgi:hypothetical protein